MADRGHWERKTLHGGMDVKRKEQATRLQDLLARDVPQENTAIPMPVSAILLRRGDGASGNHP